MILKGVSTLFIFSMLVLTLVLGLVILNNNLSERVNIVSFTGNIIEDDFIKNETYRFNSTDISYSISKNCSRSQTVNAVKAFDIINNVTILNFYKKEFNEDIYVECLDPNKTIEQNNILAEGGPDKYMEINDIKVIQHGIVKLYDDEDCNKPITVMHEIFHVLSYEHSSDVDDIMYPISYCDQRINDYLIEDIHKTYNGSLYPDLTYQFIFLSPHNNFIDIDVEIINDGYVTAENIIFYIDSKSLNRVVDIGIIKSKEGKKIKLRNLAHNEKDLNLILTIDKENKINEINEVNNQKFIRINETSISIDNSEL